MHARNYVTIACFFRDIHVVCWFSRVVCVSLANQNIETHNKSETHNQSGKGTTRNNNKKYSNPARGSGVLPLNLVESYVVYQKQVPRIRKQQLASCMKHPFTIWQACAHCERRALIAFGRRVSSAQRIRMSGCAWQPCACSAERARLSGGAYSFFWQVCACVPFLYLPQFWRGGLVQKHTEKRAQGPLF